MARSKIEPNTESCNPPRDTRDLLPDADFSDAFRLTLDAAHLDAPSATRRVLDHPADWIVSLMKLRNALVSPFGLKHGPGDRAGKAGIRFPIISESPQRVVLGMNDRHLDFRLVVDVSDPDAERQTITATTLVRTHNVAGKLYLAAVMPFHRMIVPRMLASVEQ